MPAGIIQNVKSDRGQKEEAQGATADLAQGEATKVPVREGRDPDHKEDFTRLLNEAARKRE